MKFIIIREMDLLIFNIKDSEPELIYCDNEKLLKLLNDSYFLSGLICNTEEIESAYKINILCGDHKIYDKRNILFKTFKSLEGLGSVDRSQFIPYDRITKLYYAAPVDILINNNRFNNIQYAEIYFKSLEDLGPSNIHDNLIIKLNQDIILSFNDLNNIHIKEVD